MLFKILFCLFFTTLSATPWGTDSQLVLPLPSSPPPSQNLIQTFGRACIQFHQDVISPADGPRSHFIPSSSQYTKDAISKHGFLKGFLMGCDRLQRENKEPWVYRKTQDANGYEMKWDPVK